MSRPGRLASAGLLMAALAGCIREGNTGFVQIRVAPPSATAPPSLYLDSVKLDPPKKGEAVLVHKSGTSRLQIEGWGGQLAALCDIVVRKNRVTTVTVSTVPRPPRCQCGRSADQSAAGLRTCVS